VTGLGLHIPLWDRFHLVINFFQIRLGLLWYHYKISQFYRRTNSVGVWLEVRRRFFYRCHPRRNKSVGFTFVGDSPFHRYISRKNKKTIYRRFYRRKVPKKKDSRLKYTDGFSFRRWNWIYRRKLSVVTSVGEIQNTDRICPSVNSSVLVEATDKWWRIKSVGKSVGECLKYRPNSSVGKILGNSFFLNLFLKNYLGYII
jgi:hypothetical protein